MRQMSDTASEGPSLFIAAVMAASRFPSEFRGIFHPDEEPAYWKQATAGFPNGVPRFSSKTEAESFVRQYCEHGSNPDELHLHHSITTLVDWNQIERHLLPKIAEYRTKWRTVDRAHHDSNSTYSTDTEKVASETTLRIQAIRHQNRYLRHGSPTSDEDKEMNEEQQQTPDERSEDANPVYSHLLSRLDLSIHAEMSSLAVLNTLKYLFHHMKCGIYVMIRNNQVAIFCPFVNKHYKNTWSNDLQLDCPDGKVETYFHLKGKHYRPENYIAKDEWWANGNIICNEHTKKNDKDPSQWWGDHFLFQLKDMLAETCNMRTVPDCEFFINKRDYPQLKYNVDRGIATEPYGFIFDRDDRNADEDVPLARHLYKSYAPILSFYSSSRFADIPIPPSEDWEAATGEVFPPGFDYSYDEQKQLVIGSARDLFTRENLKKFERPWSEKVPTAFFRGTATGGGVTVETNQRLHAAYLSHMWSTDSRYNGQATTTAAASSSHSVEDDNNENQHRSYPYLDAKITGWNLRDKKISAGKMTFLKKSMFPFSGDRTTNFVPIYEQSKYKYVLYIEGHCAACRYGFMMQLGSVILKVDSTCVADQMWYFPLLQPYVDHVPVKSDLSDLMDCIEWCRSHDEECQKMVANAKALYDQYISRDGILDYMQSIFYEVSRRYCPEPSWAVTCPFARSFPYFPAISSDGKQRCCVKDTGDLCTSCAMLRDREAKVAVSQAQPVDEKTLEKKQLRQLKRERDIEEMKKKRLRESS